MSGASIINLRERRAQRRDAAQVSALADEFEVAAREVGMTHAERIAFLEAALAWFEKRRSEVDAEIARLSAHSAGMTMIGTQIEARLSRMGAHRDQNN